MQPVLALSVYRMRIRVAVNESMKEDSVSDVLLILLIAVAMNTVGHKISDFEQIILS